VCGTTEVSEHFFLGAETPVHFFKTDSKETDMSKLTGKVAVVTGACKGTGAAMAKLLGGEGTSTLTKVRWARRNASPNRGERSNAAFGNISSQRCDQGHRV
jgi:hypothetical protein